jgi:Domain of unknown function (DUF4384)
MNLANQTLFLTTLLYLTVQGCCTTDQTKTDSEASKTVVPSPSPQTQVTTAVDTPPLVQASPSKLPETNTDTGTNLPAIPTKEEMPSETGKVPQKTEEAKGSDSTTPPVENKKDEKKEKEKPVDKPQKISPEGEKMKSEDKPQTASMEVAVKYYYRHKEDTGFFKKLESNSQLFSGDLYTIKFTPKEDGYVYVYQVSGNDEILDLMVKSKTGYRVVGNETVILPAKNEAFSLDDMTGHEEIYVLAFKKRNTTLENQYATLSNNSGNKAKLQEEMLNMLKETATEKVSFKHDKKTNTKETQP